MKIGICGYGRMGKLIARLAEERQHQIVHICDLPTDTIADADLYIDFSTAEALAQRLPEFCERQIPLVIGTTGWYDEREAYAALFQKHQNKGIWSGNFSLGVILFWEIVARAAAQMAPFAEQYEPMIHEWHHNRKLDAPSGTALQTAQHLLQHFPSKTRVVTETLQRPLAPEELHVSSTRGGQIPGTHSVIFDSLFDSLEIRHTARNREGFALGAILAAEKLAGLPVGLYAFADVFFTDQT